MKTYILYTTSKSNWIKEQADIFAKEISKTKGRGEVKITVVTNKLPTPPKMVLRPDGYYMPSWEWFSTNYPKGDFDAVIAHFTPYYRTKWGIKGSKGPIGGSRRSENKEYPQFWVCADLATEPADGYPEWVNDFLRKMFHEHAHYDEDQDDTVGNVLTQNSVHDVDYKLKKIHQYHYLVDYRGKDLKEKVNKLVTQIIKLAKKYI
jgi:hypothetical protein